MDRLLTKSERRKDRLKIVWKWGAGLLSGAVAVAVVMAVAGPRISEREFRTGAVDRGPIDFAVMASGKIVPGYAETVNSPIDSRIVEVFKRPGDRVEAGEPLLRLDLAEAETDYGKLQDERRMKELQLEQLRISNRNSLSELEMKIRIQEMELDRKRAVLQNERHLDSLGAGTADKVREAELAYTVAGMQLEQDRQLLLNRRELAAADEAVKELELEVFLKGMEQTRRRLEDARIRAPYSATLTSIETEIGARVSAGMKIASLADLTRFKVEGEMGDLQASRISAGCRTAVVAGRDTLNGYVAELSPVSKNGVIPFTVRLEDASAEGLRSGLRCDLYVVYGCRDQVLRLPNGSYYKQPGEYRLFVRQGGDLVRRTVRLGESNYDYVEVISGLEPGEEVVLDELERYQRYERVKIK